MIKNNNTGEKEYFLCKKCREATDNPREHRHYVNKGSSLIELTEKEYYLAKTGNHGRIADILSYATILLIIGWTISLITTVI